MNLLIPTYMQAAAFFLLSAVLAPHATAAFVPVFGGPEYDSVAGNGYRFPRIFEPFAHNLVNNTGMGIGTADKYVSGISQSHRAFQWSSSGAPPVELNIPAHFVGSHRWAYAINNAGTIVGATANSTFGERPMRWDSSGAPTELGILGTAPGGTFTWGQAYAINDAGVVVGYTDRWDRRGTTGDYVDRAVRWDAAGAVTELGDLSPGSILLPRSRAHAVNETGTAVGYAQRLSPGDRGTRAVRWDGSVTAATELGNLGTGATGITQSEAYDVNESGTAVGWADKYVSGINAGARAVRWEASGTAATELGTLGGSGFSRAQAINDVGVAVGFAPKSSGGLRAVRWNALSTAAIELGNLGADASGQAFDINNRGIAVGEVTKFAGSSAEFHAVAWGPNAIAIDLNDLIDPSSGWILRSAHSISDTGWITGLGLIDPDGVGGRFAYERVFLLQLPEIPEPATTTLMLVAIVGSSGVRFGRLRLQLTGAC